MTGASAAWRHTLSHDTHTHRDGGSRITTAVAVYARAEDVMVYAASAVAKKLPARDQIRYRQSPTADRAVPAPSPHCALNESAAERDPSQQAPVAVGLRARGLRRRADQAAGPHAALRALRAG